MAWQCSSPEVAVIGPLQWMVLIMILCGMTVGMVTDTDW